MSKYQTKIYDWVSNNTNNGIIIAVAGSGKTTTGIKVIELIDRRSQVLFCAFNRDIKLNIESKTKHMFHVDVKTYNGLGWKVSKDYFGKNIELNQYKVLDCLQTILKKDYKKYKVSVKKCIDLIRSQAILNPTIEDLKSITDYYDINIDNLELVLDVYKMMVSNTKIFDYQDQLYMPIKYNLNLPQYDFLISDESQDCDPLQLELLMRSCIKGRKLFIGDPKQAIYGFRGATFDSMEIIKKRIQATELPLSICYRCSKNVVLEAQKYVDYIEPWEHSPEGSVDEVKTLSNVTEDDFVLCRLTAPLFTSCLDFIRKGIPSYIRGRDIGVGIIELLDKISVDNVSITDFYDMMIDYKMKTLKEDILGRKEDLLLDQITTIIALMEGCQTKNDIVKKVESICKEGKSKGICHMTIHKSKGLETSNVYIIPGDVKPRKDWQLQEEINLKYVSVTRAKDNLFYLK